MDDHRAVMALSATPDNGDSFTFERHFTFSVEDIDIHKTADGDHNLPSKNTMELDTPYSGGTASEDKPNPFPVDALAGECNFIGVGGSVERSMNISCHGDEDGRDDDGSESDNESFASSMCFDVDAALSHTRTGQEMLDMEGEGGIMGAKSGIIRAEIGENRTNELFERIDVGNTNSRLEDVRSDLFDDVMSLMTIEGDACFVDGSCDVDINHTARDDSAVSQVIVDLKESVALGVEQSYTPCVEQSYTPGVEQSYTPGVEQSYTPCVEQSYTPGVERKVGISGSHGVDNSSMPETMSTTEDLASRINVIKDNDSPKVPERSPFLLGEKAKRKNDFVRPLEVDSHQSAVRGGKHIPQPFSNPITPTYKPRPSPYHRTFSPLSATPSGFSPAFKTPIQAQYKAPNNMTPSNKHATPQTQMFNRFEAGMLERLHLPVFSPSVFTTMSTPNSCENRPFWSIDQAAILNPVDIDATNYQSPFSLLNDQENEARVQRAIRQYFTSNLIAPSPYQAPQPHRLPATPAHDHEMARADMMGYMSAPGPIRIKTTQDVVCQTVLTLPVNFDLNEYLGEHMTYKAEDDAQEVLSTSTLRRKLFFQGDTSCVASPSPVRQTPDSGTRRLSKNSPASDHFSSSPIALTRSNHFPRTSLHQDLFMSPDLSPVKHIHACPNDYKTQLSGSFLGSPPFMASLAPSGPTHLAPSGPTNLARCTPDVSPINCARQNFPSFNASPVLNSSGIFHPNLSGNSPLDRGKSPLLAAIPFNPLADSGPTGLPDMSPINADTSASSLDTQARSASPLLKGAPLLAQPEHSPPLLPLSDYLDFSPSGVSTPDKRKERSQVTSSSTTPTSHSTLAPTSLLSDSPVFRESPGDALPPTPATTTGCTHAPAHDSLTTFELSLSADASDRDGQSSNHVSQDTGYQTSSLQSTNINQTSCLQLTGAQDSGVHSNLTHHFSGLPFRSFLDADPSNTSGDTPKSENPQALNTSRNAGNFHSFGPAAHRPMIDHLLCYNEQDGVPAGARTIVANVTARYKHDMDSLLLPRILSPTETAGFFSKHENDVISNARSVLKRVGGQSTSVQDLRPMTTRLSPSSPSAPLCPTFMPECSRGDVRFHGSTIVSKALKNANHDLAMFEPVAGPS